MTDAAGVINTQWFDHVVDELDALSFCPDLQGLADKLMAKIQKLLDSVDKKIQELAPYLELLTNPGAVLVKLGEWVKKFIDAQIKPYVSAYVTLGQQLIAYAQQIVRVVNALNAAAGRIGQCVLNIVPIVIPTMPALPEGVTI